MAPPKTYSSINPTVVPFEEVTVRSFDNSGKSIVSTDFRPPQGSGYEILTEDVLNSGNLDLLYNFRTGHQKELSDPKYAPAKRYLDARIQNAEKLQAYENKAKLFAAQRKAPAKPMVVEANGFIGLTNTRYPDYQTSANGCWSIAYSTLLKSRGVELSQEEIRQWRPDYRENAAPNEKANKERKVLMNTDAGNSIYNNADLVGKVLPNTAVNMLQLEPCELSSLSIQGKPLNAAQRQIVEEEYLAQVKEQLRTTLTRAFVEHQSPVALNLDGHYVTITGLSLDGNTILYEDSLGAETNAPRTRTMTMDSLVEQGMLQHSHNGKLVPGQGIELTWLSDLPVSEIGKRQSALDPNRFVTTDRNGAVSVRVPHNHSTLTAAGSPVQGQVSSKAVEQSFVLDQTKLARKLNGAKVTGWGVGGGILFGTVGTSYPGRVMRPGDPRLLAEAVSAQAGAFSKLHAGLDYFTANSATEADKARVSAFKNALSAFQQAAAGKAVDLDKARETLAGMYDFLQEKPNGSNKTRFETGFRGMGVEARKDFVENLRAIDFSLGLGREAASSQLAALHESLQAEALVDQRRNDAKARYTENMVELWSNVQKNAAFRDAKGSPQQAEMHFNLTLIAANFFAYQKNLRDHKDPPFPTDKDVSDYLGRIQGSEPLRRTLEGKMTWLGNKSKYPMDFIQDLYAADRQVAEEKRQKQKEVSSYAIPKEDWKRRRHRIQIVAALLQNSKTGSYVGADALSRSKNSDKFDQAMDAIRKTALTSEKEPPSAENVKTSVDTVLAYVKGKEKKRGSEFGRNRWASCMRFLADTMPRKDFEAYCDHVNQVRGVKPGHPDHVSPETFYPTLSNAKYVMDDTITRIRSGQNTLRDYARLIAARKVGMRNGGAYLDYELIKSDKQRTELCVETEKVLGDKRFASFVEGTDKRELSRMLENGAAGFNQVWEGYKTRHPIAEQPAANKAEAPAPQMQLYR